MTDISCSNWSSRNAPLVPMWITMFPGSNPSFLYACSTTVASQNCRLTFASTKIPGIASCSDCSAPSITESPTARISCDNGLLLGVVVTVVPVDPLGPDVPVLPLTPVDPVGPVGPDVPLGPRVC